MVTNPKSLIRTIFTATIGCGCSRPKASEAYHPIPKSKHKTKNERSISKTVKSTPSTRNGGGGGGDTITVSLNPKIGESVAVVKESEDPYRDFRESMMQMILEKQMYSKDELEELLDCFLHLNSPSHHDVIVRAFSEICNIISTRPDQLQS